MFLASTVEAAREALSDMPPRSESELDAVTLHNQVCVCVSQVFDLIVDLFRVYQ